MRTGLSSVLTVLAATASLAPCTNAAAAACRPTTSAPFDETAPDDETAARKQEEKRIRAEAETLVGDGWTLKEYGRCLLLSQDSDTRAKDFAEHAEAMFDWLDDTFPSIGPERYVRGPILRVAKDYDELGRLKTRAKHNPWSGTPLEILVCRGNWGSASNQIDAVGTRAMRIWFAEKSSGLYPAFPRWLRSGLWDLAADARTKRGKLVHKDDDSDRTKLKDALRRGSLVTAQELMQMSSAEFEQNAATYQQSGQLLAFLVSGKAQPKKLTKDVLAHYVTHLTSALAEVPEDTEDRAKKTRQLAFERTFADWESRDWAKFEKSFERYFQ